MYLYFVNFFLLHAAKYPAIFIIFTVFIHISPVGRPWDFGSAVIPLGIETNSN